VSDRRDRAVAHLLWRAEIGGIERLVCDLAVQQIYDGLRVTVAFGQARGPFVQRLQAAGARVLDLRLRSGWDLGPSRIRAGAAELRSADVLHLHGFNPAFGLLAGRTGRPVVFTEHGNFALGRQIDLREKVKRRLHAAFLRRVVTRLAANSAHTADRLAGLYGVPRSSVAVIHNGIDPSWLDLDEARSGANGDGRLRIATLGRLVRFKRIDRAIEGLARAAGRDRMQLSIVGRGPLEGELRSLAASLGVDDRVQFLGDRVDVAATLAASDLLVHPSENEPFGLAILEACAQGALPIVFADAGGALEIIPPDGVVVDGVAELAHRLDGLTLSPALAPEARRTRAAWVRERFPISRTAEKYAELYETAAGRR
jgi:glycosyltransferase involved in cell wall biosynthesis